MICNPGQRWEVVEIKNGFELCAEGVKQVKFPGEDP